MLVKGATGIIHYVFSVLSSSSSSSSSCLLSSWWWVIIICSSVCLGIISITSIDVVSISVIIYLYQRRTKANDQFGRTLNESNVGPFSFSILDFLVTCCVVGVTKTHIAQITITSCHQTEGKVCWYNFASNILNSDWFMIRYWISIIP